MHRITINKALNGYVVDVGCQTIVIEGDTKLLVELGRYIANPAEVEKEWLSKYSPNKDFMPIEGGGLDPRYTTANQACEQQRAVPTPIGNATRGTW